MLIKYNAADSPLAARPQGGPPSFFIEKVLGGIAENELGDSEGTCG